MDRVVARFDVEVDVRALLLDDELCVLAALLSERLNRFFGQLVCIPPVPHVLAQLQKPEP